MQKFWCESSTTLFSNSIQIIVRRQSPTEVLPKNNHWHDNVQTTACSLESALLQYTHFQGSQRFSGQPQGYTLSPWDTLC